MIDTDRDWEQFAQDDAYFSVLTDARFAHIGDDADARRAFFQSGEKHVDHLFEKLGRLGDSSPAAWDVLDFGCGVGRLLVPLALRCNSAFGVDVAPTMLREARRNLAEFRCENAGAGLITEIPAGQRFDLVHSVITFQHIPVKRGSALLRELLVLLKPEGRIALHFTFARTYRHSAAGWKIASQFPGLVPYLRLLRGRNPLKPRMLMGRYDINDVLQALHEAEISSCEVEIVNDGGNLGAMIFGRKLRATQGG